MRALRGMLVVVAALLGPATGAAAARSDPSRCCFRASVDVRGSMLVDYGSDPGDPANGRHEMSWAWSAREIVRYHPRGQTVDGRTTPDLRPVRRGGREELPAKVRYRFAERSSITTRGVDGLHRAPQRPCRDHTADRGETAANGGDRVEFASRGWRFAKLLDLPVFEIARANGNHPAVARGRVALSAILSRVVTAYDAHCGPSGWAHTPGEPRDDPMHPPGLAPWQWIQVAAPSVAQFARSRRITRTVTWTVNPPLNHGSPPHVTTQQLRATFRFTWFSPKGLRAEVRRFLRR